MLHIVTVAAPRVSRWVAVRRYSRIAWPWVKWLAGGTGKILLATILAPLLVIGLGAWFMSGFWRGPV